jgi:hypothetical protein
MRIPDTSVWIGARRFRTGPSPSTSPRSGAETCKFPGGPAARCGLDRGVSLGANAGDHRPLDSHGEEPVPASQRGVIEGWRRTQRSCSACWRWPIWCWRDGSYSRKRSPRSEGAERVRESRKMAQNLFRMSLKPRFKRPSGVPRWVRHLRVMRLFVHSVFP